MNITLYDLSVWVLPLIIAITFHEAAHGFVAHALGDNKAVAAFKELMHSVATVKERHNRKACRPRQR